MSYSQNAGPLPPYLDPRGRHRGGRAWRSGTKRVALVVATLISLASLVVAGYAWYEFRDLNNGITRIKVTGLGSAPSGKKDIDGTDQNILLVGNDDRTKMTDAEVKALHVGRDGGSMATDTMMILHVPADGKKATLISLPRDSYVSIPGHGMNRLNAAYVDGYNSITGTADQKQSAGADLLLTTVGNLTGLTINHYVQISLLGFYEISKALGGIPVNMCESVDDTHAHNEAEGQDGGSGLVLSKGKHVLTAVQSLEFVRQRHNLPGGDLDRVKRQQYFLTAAFRKASSAGVILEFKSLSSAIKRNIILDPSLNLLNLATQMENLSANNIVGKTIPSKSETIDGMDVLAVNPTKVQAFVAKLVEPAPSTPSSSASSSAPTSSSASSTSAPSPSASSSSTAPIDSKCIN